MTNKELYATADYKSKRGMMFNADCMSVLPSLGGAVLI